jgi:hypothetical protein
MGNFWDDLFRKQGTGGTMADTSPSYTAQEGNGPGQPSATQTVEQTAGTGPAARSQGYYVPAEERNGGQGGGGEDGSYDINASAFNQPNYARSRQQAQDGYNLTSGRKAQQYGGANIATGPQDQLRQRQMGLVEMLQGQAAGYGDSAARAQFQQATDRNLSQAIALGASQRGAGRGGALRGIANQQAAIGQQAAVDSGQLRMQEQIQAQNQLAQVLAGTRGQDLGLATGQAQLSQQAGMANQAASLQQESLNNNMMQYYMSMGFNLDQAKAAAAQALEAARAQRYGLEKGLAVQTRGQDMQLAGATVQAAGSTVSGLAASDRNLKKNIKSGDKEAYSFLDALSASKYKYKEPEKDGEGEQLSVMAQELEKTEVGKRFVKDTPRGKMVDYGKGLAAMLASSASLHHRLKKLEAEEGD